MQLDNMAKKMLIDATHAEETRVVVVDGNKVEEFDFESENKRQLAGNIYLAKVTRVEPSLQAAFVDYGGNRHGFLAFSEIHPDYYQIPVADREALMEEERAYAEAMKARDEEEEKPRNSRSRSRSKSRAEKTASDDAVVSTDLSDGQITGMETIDLGDDALDPDEAYRRWNWWMKRRWKNPTTISLTPRPVTRPPTTPPTPPTPMRLTHPKMKHRRLARLTVTRSTATRSTATKMMTTETRMTGTGTGANPTPRQRTKPSNPSPMKTTAKISAPVRKPRPRRYKIQEVIKVRQILLVQVVKEERGNKGAALTTYLSLAGRYCVLMPNTARGGGISRKITNAADRKKLKEIAGEIDVPKGAGLIVRTAGAKRTKSEIKRDYEYLQRMWEQIRELTLKSIAPAKIYEEGNLIKRSIRDLYNRDIDEVLVEGERGYRIAKDFMKMIMPSHAKNVKHYGDDHAAVSRAIRWKATSRGMFNPDGTAEIRRLYRDRRDRSTCRHRCELGPGHQGRLDRGNRAQDQP